LKSAFTFQVLTSQTRVGLNQPGGGHGGAVGRELDQRGDLAVIEPRDFLAALGVVDADVIVEPGGGDECLAIG
jgi:hypothetical protein